MFGRRMRTSWRSLCSKTTARLTRALPGTRTTGRTTTVAAITIPVTIATRSAARFRIVLQTSLAASTIENLTFIDPGLHADNTVGGPRFAESIIEIGTQRV